MINGVHGQYAKVGNFDVFLSRHNLKTLRHGLEALAESRKRIMERKARRVLYIPKVQQALDILESIDLDDIVINEAIYQLESYIND